jgi:predicted nucleic acid-binding protein
LSAAYVDSSCLVAVVFGEASGVGAGRRLRRYDRLFASNLLEAELCSAAEREGVALARPTVFQDILWVFPSRPLSREIDRAIAAGYLRGADLWHVATALYLKEDVPELDFLTLDRLQADVAGRLGFATPLRASQAR